MSLALVFWLVMFLWAIFGTWNSWPAPGAPNFRPLGSHFLIFIVLALLGWKVFGAPIHG